MRYFLDENASSKLLISALRAAGLDVTPYGDLFSPGEPDAIWIPEVTRRGFIILTLDRQVRKKPNELAAIKASSARILALPGKKQRMDERAATFLTYIQKISRHLEKAGPFFITISPTGGIRELPLHRPMKRRPGGSDRTPRISDAAVHAFAA